MIWLRERDSAFHLLQSQGDGLIADRAPHDHVDKLPSVVRSLRRYYGLIRLLIRVHARRAALPSYLRYCFTAIGNEIHGGLSLDMLI
jgi:hypothetical protein